MPPLRHWLLQPAQSRNPYVPHSRASVRNSAIKRPAFFMFKRCLPIAWRDAPAGIRKARQVRIKQVETGYSVMALTVWRNLS